jgi:hypothetical protein
MRCLFITTTRCVWIIGMVVWCSNNGESGSYKTRGILWWPWFRLLWRVCIILRLMMTYCWLLHARTCEHARSRTKKNTDTHTHTHLRTHARSHTHTNTHTHTHTRLHTRPYGSRLTIDHTNPHPLSLLLMPKPLLPLSTMHYDNIAFFHQLIDYFRHLAFKQ